MGYHNSGRGGLMSDVRQWLAGLGLERFAEAFEREEGGSTTCLS